MPSYPIAMKHFFLLLICLVFVFSCKPKRADTLFQLRSSEETGIHFENTIMESDTFNILTTEYIYNGGGVGVADFNNDGLQDVFFVGNLVPNKLYLNKGDFQFEDISDVAAINVPGKWNSGVAIADVNNDGWMDMYVCATMKADSADRKNMLFINKGLNEKGIPVFKDEAKQYGLEDGGYSVTSAFLDYDKDGDLDLYILVNQRLTKIPTNYRPKITDGSSPNNDKLYRNNGDGTFSNVTKEAGITIEGFGLGLSVTDFNMDGWPDIYVSNDYLSNDLLYINNKNGTFTNRIKEFISHQSQFSMGNDAADINNDALPDIITTDMLPETNARKKTMVGNKSYQNYINNEMFGYEYQYVRNMLHLNNGLNKEIRFSEIGQLAGVYQTEWSWSPLFADFDNDGYRDLIITNGFPKDVTDRDFANYRADVGNVASPGYLNDSIPVVKIPNYGFRNGGNLAFTDVTKQWGLGDPSFSNGAAYVDLDNDGDLDYIVNNINGPAFVYDNTLYTKDVKKEAVNNYLRIKLKGTGNNPQAIGAKIILYYQGGQTQLYENTFYRGFLSSVEAIGHFGLGEVKKIDSVFVQWPDGKMQLQKNVSSNQLLTIAYDPDQSSLPVKTENKLVEKSTIAYKHSEQDYIDFNSQRTQPHKFSQSGPGIAVGDVNGDGREDVIISGAVGHEHTIFLQGANGSFSLSKKEVFDQNKKEEDEGLLLFDADGDGDNDLYVVGGGVEGLLDSAAYQDKFYLNDGKGNFKWRKDALPKTNASGSCVRAADYDGDGDLDLFVGGRVVPGAYPMPAESYLLQNDKGKFTNVTKKACADLAALGMITDALWTDIDNDGKTDLMIAGEFMEIVFFKNDGSTLTRLTSTGLSGDTGWWNSITAGDYDKDGDTDYVVGNLGWNNAFQVTKQYPLKVIAKDFDGNGSIDPVMACYIRETMNADTRQLYPAHFWDEMNSQSPKFRRKFSRYRQFSVATVDKVLNEEEMKGTLVLEANNLSSSYIENLGNGKFKMSALPVLTQIAPVNGLLTTDVNEDGNPDVVMVGNDYGNEVFIGRYDAFTGLVLLGNGKGDFDIIPSAKSGFYVPGDAKALARLTADKGELYMATQNQDSLRVFISKREGSQFIFKPGTLDVRADLHYADGTIQHVEFYYGSGYLSQSSRRVRIPKEVKEITVSDSKGGSRKVVPSGI
jgi:hypothetical protein